MRTEEIQIRIAEMRRINADMTHIEAKAAASELPQRLWPTLSAFSNTRGAGTLLLGVSEQQQSKVTGVENPSKIQHDLACLCSEMEPPVRASIEVHEIDGKFVVAAVVPEIPSSSKPCYHRESGYTNGAFIRIADGNRKLSAYEVQMMLAARTQPKDDEEAVTESGIEDLQPRLVKVLLSRLRRRPGSPFAKLKDESVLRTIKVLIPFRNRSVCSLGGLLALGVYPQGFFPALGITFVVYPEMEVGRPGARQERFLDNQRIEGPIPAMLAPILAALERNMKRKSVVRGLYREDATEYPVTAVREAVVNALVHRDLSSTSRGTPVQVNMFSNRLVVQNPGGLYGPVTVDSLGQGISATRNNMMLRALEDVTAAGERQAVCENRGSGVGAMKDALRQADLPAPVFEDRVATFRVTLLNTPLPKKKDRRDDIKALLRDHESLSRGEISQALGLTDISVRKYLALMRDEGLVVTNDQKAKSKNVRYRLAP
jgi:ATP-dependent DNA helicase RecG